MECAGLFCIIELVDPLTKTVLVCSVLGGPTANIYLSWLWRLAVRGQGAGVVGFWGGPPSWPARGCFS